MGVRVVQATQFGSPDVLVIRETSDPLAGYAQAVVDVAVVDVLFVETEIRRQGGGDYFAVQPPYVPGSGVAGRVMTVGQAVDVGWVGQRVVAYTGEGGGYVERAVVPADGLIRVPDGLGLAEAAALLHDGNTAVGLFEGTGAVAGEWVLVTAAGGGLGLLLVQLAHAAGARVIAAARGKHKLDLARTLGADVIVDYSEASWLERVVAASGGTGPNVVFDGVGGQIGRDAFEVITRGGRFSAHGASSGAFAEIDPEEARWRGVTVRGIEQVQGRDQWRRRATHALAEAAAGRIKPIIGQTFPLERAADAHAAIESRAVTGKTLLLIADPPE